MASELGECFVACGGWEGKVWGRADDGCGGFCDGRQSDGGGRGDVGTGGEDGGSGEEKGAGHGSDKWVIGTDSWGRVKSWDAKILAGYWGGRG